MRKFLLTASTADGDQAMIIETQDNSNICMEVSGDDFNEEQRELLNKLDVEYNPNDPCDYVTIVELRDVPTRTI